MERNMDVPEMPLSYRWTGARNMVTPVAFTMPAMVRQRKFQKLSFSFCNVFIAHYLNNRDFCFIGMACCLKLYIFETHFLYYTTSGKILQGKNEIKYNMLHFYKKCAILRVGMIKC